MSAPPEDASLRLAIAQFRPDKGDTAHNLERIGQMMRRALALDSPADLLLFPEAALTGYFLEGGVHEHAWTAEGLVTGLADEHERAVSALAPDGDQAAAHRPLDVAVGFYEEHEHRLYNSVLYAELGRNGPRLVHVHRKVFLATYGVFQEERFVEPGGEIAAFDTRWGRAALLICEDAFHSISSMLASLDGAQTILIPSASPARGISPGPGIPGSLERWRRLARGIAEEHGVFVALAQLAGFEGGKGFPGGSVVFGPRGEVQAEGPLWDEALVTADLALGGITAARASEPLLADLERALPVLLRNSELCGGEAREAAADDADAAAPPGPRDVGAPRLPESRVPEPAHRAEPPPARRAEPAPTHRDPARDREAVRIAAPKPGHPRPGDLSPLRIDTELVAEWLRRFLVDEIVRRRGFKHAIVGISGGVDSSLTAALCAGALGPEAVTGLILPYRTSSSESREHALAVAERFGIEAVEIDITAAVDGYLKQHAPDADDLRRGNVMARERMIVTFDQAAKRAALPVGTGNKSERLLGYFTWHADDSPPINPLGDLFKTQVWELARAVGVPADILGKPASADLVRGQTDEQDLGISYAEADVILHWLVNGETPERLVASGFDRSKVETVHARLEGTHWKRNPPTVAVLSPTAIGEWYLRPVDY